MVFVSITENIIDPALLSAQAESPAAGALVVFIGNVRDNARGKTVQYLEYEAYLPLAEKELRRIAEEAQKNWKIDISISHRLGRVEVGEASIVVAVSSAHRAEAFEACRWLIDAIKQRAPIWKKEHFIGGAHWIEGSDAVLSDAAQQ